MITCNLFVGPELHPSPHYQNQYRTVGDALEEIVRVLRDENNYGCRIEGFGDANGAKPAVVKIGSYGMAGEKWIHVYEGSNEEIWPLTDVCHWFYKAGGKASKEASDLFKFMELGEHLQEAPRPPRQTPASTGNYRLVMGQAARASLPGRESLRLNI